MGTHPKLRPCSISIHEMDVSIYACWWVEWCRLFTTRAARVVLFSVASVCVFVCLFVCLSVNMITREPLDIITKFPRHHRTVERADKFENGYTYVHGWCSSVVILFFYRAMHFSAKRGLPIACRPSVRPSVCDVGDSRSHV